MPFEFPNAPVAGDTHSEFGVDYVYDGTVWNLASGGAMTDYVQKAGDTMTGPLKLHGPNQMLEVAAANGIKTISINASGAPHAGLIEFWDPANGTTRRGYLGYGDANRLNLVAETGNWSVSGGLDVINGGIYYDSTSAVTSVTDFSKGLCLYGYGSTSQFGLNITSGTLNLTVQNTGNLIAFNVGSEQVMNVKSDGLRIPGGNLSVTGNIATDSYIEMNGGTLYIDRTASGYGDSPPIEFRQDNEMTARLRGGSSNDSGYGQYGGFDLTVMHGSYGVQNVMDVPNGQGAAAANMCALNSSAFNVTSDARLKENIRPVTPEEVNRLFGALRPVHFDRLTVLGEGATPEVCVRSTPEYGFVANDIARDGKELVITMNVDNAETLVYSLNQVLAMTIAKIKLLEAEIEVLKAPRRRR